MNAAGSRPFGLRGPLGAWRPLDRWVVGYALATLPFLGWGWAQGRMDCRASFLANLLVIAANRLLAAWTSDTRRIVPTVARLFFAPMVYVTFYRQIQVLWPLLRATPLDAGLVRAEAALFGCQPSLAFRAALPWRGLSELFCAAYYLYYFFTPAVGLTALARSGYEAAERILLAATATFLTFYALFWIFPTVGPHFWFPPAAGPRLYDGYVFNRLLFLWTRAGEIRGGAFPSSHIAVATLFTLLARREVKPLFLPLALVTALMLPAVVYLHAHYLLDVPAGLASGVLAYGISRRLIRGPRGA